MKWYKKISFKTYCVGITWIIKLMIDIIHKWNYEEPFKTYNTYGMIFIGFIIAIRLIVELIQNKNTKELIGIPSGDYEVEVFDCIAESFKNYIGEEPDETSESCFYKDLYMIYRIPITEHMRNLSKDNNLLKIKVNDKGVQSVKKLKQKAIKKD